MNVKVVKFRVARPTSDLQALRSFYLDDLGLTDRGSFEDHNGYDGLLVGADDESYEIEFTQHDDVRAIAPPSDDHLLVFYLRNRAEVSAIEARLAARGHHPVTPLNPYWVGKSLTYVDPDGWRVVLFDREAIG